MRSLGTGPSRRAVIAATVAAGIGAGLGLAGCAPEPVAPTPRPVPAPVPEPVPAPEQQAAATAMLLVSLARGQELALVDPEQAFIDPAQRPAGAGEPVQTIAVGAAPWGIGVHAESGVAYAATSEGLAVIDLARRERVALVAYQHPSDVRQTGEYRPGGLGLAVAPDGSRVYVAVTPGDGNFFLEVFDVAAGQFTGSVPVGIRPFDVVVAPDGAWAATVDHDSFTVTVVDAATLQSTVREVAPFGTEGGLASWEKPHYGAVDGNGTILLPYQGQVVVRLDPATGEATSLPSAANSHAHGTALAGRQLLTVGTGSFGSATGEPNLSVLNIDTGEERIVPLKVPHETVAVWRDAAGREYAAVAGGNTRDAGWDGITLVALDDLSVREIPVPGYPQAIVAFDAV